MDNIRLSDVKRASKGGSAWKVKLFTHSDLDGVGCALVLNRGGWDLDVE